MLVNFDNFSCLIFGAQNVIATSYTTTEEFQELLKSRASFILKYNFMYFIYYRGVTSFTCKCHRIVYSVTLPCSHVFYYCSTSFIWEQTQILSRYKSCLQHIEGFQWWKNQAIALAKIDFVDQLFHKAFSHHHHSLVF